MRKLILFILLAGLGVYGQAQSLKGYSIGDKIESGKRNVENISVAGVKGNLLLGVIRGELDAIIFNGYVGSLYKANEFKADVMTNYNVKFSLTERDGSDITYEGHNREVNLKLSIVLSPAGGYIVVLVVSSYKGDTQYRLDDF